MYHILHRPTAKAMWYPTLIINASVFLHKLTVLILHYLPAFLLDLVFIATGKKLRLVTTLFCSITINNYVYGKFNNLKICVFPVRLVDQYKKIERFTDILIYFSTKEWIFSNTNVQGLWGRLNEDDKTLFPFDIKQMHWEQYLEVYHKGIMKFLLKEGTEKLPAAKKRLRGYGKILNTTYVKLYRKHRDT